MMASTRSPVAAGRRAAVVGGTAWALASVVFVAAQVVVAQAWPIPYSLRRNVISDLGNTVCGPFAVPPGASYPVCSPLHAVMNAAFIVAGALTVAGAVGLRRWWPGGRAGSWAWWLWIVTGLGKILVGLSPENVALGPHVLGALNLPLGAAGVLVLAGALRRRAPPLATVGLVLGLVALVGSVLLVAGQTGGPAAYLGLGAGGAERLAASGADIWVLVVGLVVALGRAGRL